MLNKASNTRIPFRRKRVSPSSAESVVDSWWRVLGLALIGLLHLTRGTAVRHVRGVAADGAAIGVAEREFPLMATMATGAWLASGNRVDLMQNGDGTFPRLWEDLRSAHGRSRCSCTTARPVVWRTRSARSCVTVPRPAYVCSSFTMLSARWTSQRISGCIEGCGDRRGTFSPYPPLNAASRAAPLTRSRHRHRQPCGLDGRVRH